jgi:kumamolisin
MKQARKYIVSLFTLSIAAGGCNGDNQQACAPASPTVLAQRLSAESVSHVPAAFRNYTDGGRLDGSTTGSLTVTVSLALNHEDELDQRIARMYQRGNREFHQFITPAEFSDRYAPTPEQIAAATTYLSAHGLSSITVGESGTMIKAEGTPEALGEAFQTELHEYRDETGAAHYYAPVTEPKLPEGMLAVHGLQSLPKLRSHAHASVKPFAMGGNAMLPAAVKAAYSIPTSVTGAGQTIALVELDGYYASDISQYASAAGLQAINVQNVLVDGYSGAAGEGASEVTLDIELAAAIAPQAKIMVYEGPNSSQSLLDIFAKIASDDQASQISISWGSPETETTTAFLASENALLKQLAAQGQAVFAASGDSGAYDNDTSIGVDDPAAQPFVVAVGGTTLQTLGNAYGIESAWNNGSPTAGAGGGGISAAWAQPGWQNGVSNSQNLASSTMRNVPDVSLNANPETGYAIVFQGAWVTYGGTSCAAPLWAAFLALVNEERLSTGLGAIGFPNPAIYALGMSSNYSADFHDVREGNNLYYPSVSGFDDATGWGSFNGQALFDDLVKEPSTSNEQLSC